MTAQLWWGDEPLVAQWVADKFPHLEGFGQGRAVGWVTDDGRLIGGLVLCPRGGCFDAELSIYFEKECRPTRAQLRALFTLAFDQWGLTRLTCLIAKKNRRARDFVERIGFVREGTMRLGFDGYQHAIVYGMLRKDCKWVQDGLDSKPAESV